MQSTSNAASRARIDALRASSVYPVRIRGQQGAATIDVTVQCDAITEALNAAPDTRTLLLGCTHYPLIQPAIQRVLASLGHPLTIIDSAHATATAVAACFPNVSRTAGEPACPFYATDSIEKFQRLGSNFLGQPVAEVNLIDLGG